MPRILQNIEMQHIKLSGKGIDLGAKSSKASYYNFLTLDKDADIQFHKLLVQALYFVPLYHTKPQMSRIIFTKTRHFTAFT